MQGFVNGESRLHYVGGGLTAREISSAVRWKVDVSNIMRQEPAFFPDDEELVLVYIAKKLKEALAVEKVFTDAGLDYLVEPDTYSGGILFRTERTGAFFYVAPAKEEETRSLLEISGYKPTVLS